MRKAERLFQILTVLRARRTAITAAKIAELLEVSERTVYRDIQALIVNGVPVDGEAGIGYYLRPGFYLPPLSFTTDELQALLMGCKMAQAWSDPALASASKSAENKVRATLPDALIRQADNYPFTVPQMHIRSEISRITGELREACLQCRITAITYTTAGGEISERKIEPLCMVYWGKVWTLLAWCQLRDDYRNFRVDRIQSLSVSDEKFPPSPEKTLKHFLRKHCFSS